MVFVMVFVVLMMITMVMFMMMLMMSFMTTSMFAMIVFYIFHHINILCNNNKPWKRICKSQEVDITSKCW